MLAEPVRNYYGPEQFLYGGSSALGLFLESPVGLRVKHLHELHLIAQFLSSFAPSALVHSKNHADAVEPSKETIATILKCTTKQIVAGFFPV